MRSINNPVHAVLLRDVVPVCVAYTLVGLSFGAIATSSGVPLAVPIVLSLLVFAGSAQFAAVGIVLAGGSAAAAIVTGLMINARLMAYGFAVRDALGRSLCRRLLSAHLMTDVNTAIALQQDQPAHRRALFWQSGMAIFIVWNLAVAAGGIAGRHIADANAFGLDAALPAILFALIRPNLTDSATQRACALGSVTTLVTIPVLPPGLPVVSSVMGLLACIGVRASD
ncbi:AzlC family ABC transporter permease [Arhodomonas sp. AD133]|uniref:AzlC family ABC transporter permease n=1 Tax=Arhodomonas sp. AD133 TaxID=3415009 RepID=UPI003EBA1AF2